MMSVRALRVATAHRLGRAALSTAASPGSAAPRLVIGGMVIGAAPAVLVLRLKRDDEFRERTAAAYPTAFSMISRIIDVGPASHVTGERPNVQVARVVGAVSCCHVESDVFVCRVSVECPPRR